MILDILSSLFLPADHVPSIYYHISGGEGIDFKYNEYPFNTGYILLF